MRIVEKIIQKQKDNDYSGVTVAFLGDSVTQGCFELYKTGEKSFATVFDKSAAYHKYFAEIFEVLCPNVPVNVINAGVSGATASYILDWYEDSVLKHKPDLTVVCFGLNDAAYGVATLDKYLSSLSEIFDKLRECGSEVIFMTPNMACTEISPHLTDETIIACAKENLKRQTTGVLDLFIDSAVKLCHEMGIVVCDCYKKWKTLNAAGINTTELLANKINHPSREMNRLFAYSLVETIFNS